MRATERDQLLAKVSWIYLAVLVAVSAYFLWPRTLPADLDTREFDLASLPIEVRIDFDTVRALEVRAAGPTSESEADIRRVLNEQGGNGAELKIAIKNREHLFDTLAALRKISRKYRDLTLALRFLPTGTWVRVHRGAFDDPGGRIGHELLEHNKRAKAKTPTTGASDDKKSPALDP